MTDQMQLSLINNYINNSKDDTERTILANIYTELSYRYPNERINPGSSCPSCGKYVDSKSLFCSNCGQCIA